MATTDRPALGVIVGNRDFFPDRLVTEARADVEKLFDELGIEEDPWRYAHDEPWRLALNRAYNDRAERIVGRRLLSETPSDPSRAWPGVKGLHDVFEAKNVWRAGSWWLQQSAHSEEELTALLDRVEQRDIRKFILPDNWDEEKERLSALGSKPPLYRGQRGPVTLEQDGDEFALTFGPDFDCDPVAACAFTGSVDGNVLTGSNGGVADAEGGTYESSFVATWDPVDHIEGTGGCHCHLNSLHPPGFDGVGSSQKLVRTFGTHDSYHAGFLDQFHHFSFVHILFSQCSG